MHTSVMKPGPGNEAEYEYLSNGGDVGQVKIEVSKQRRILSIKDTISDIYSRQNDDRLKWQELIQDLDKKVTTEVYVPRRLLPDVLSIKPKVNNCMSTLKNSLKDIQECRNKCVLNKSAHT